MRGIKLALAKVKRLYAGAPVGNFGPLALKTVRSSYFDDTTKFPRGSVTFDCALLMRNIRHRWEQVTSFRTEGEKQHACGT